MKVVGIIVNYRTPEMTAQVAAALFAELQSLNSWQLFVVDNDSGDGSYEFLRREVELRHGPQKARVLQALRNGGYGYGINVAVAHALRQPQPPEYFYIINSDAFVEPGSLKRLLAHMDAHPETAVAGSLIRGVDGTCQGAAFRFPSIWSELEGPAGVGLLSRLLARHVVSLPPPGQDRAVDWISGTSMLIRSTLFEKVGLFDTGFFLYFEEVDLCRRARAAGFGCAYVANAPVTHIGCVSTGMLDQTRPMPRYWFDSRHRYLLKHHGRGYALACDAVWVTGYLVQRAKNGLLRRKVTCRPRMLGDFVRSSLRNLSSMRRPREDVEPQRGAWDERAADDLELFEILREDYATYDHDPLQPGLWAVVAHRMGVRARSNAQLPQRLLLDVGYRCLTTAVDHVWGIRLPRSVTLGRRVRLWHSGCMLLLARSIGNDVHIRHATTLGARRFSEHDPDGLPVIGDRVDLGAGVCVLGAVTVGEGAVVGANTVVMKDVPPETSVLGVPARPIPA